MHLATKIHAWWERNKNSVPAPLRITMVIVVGLTLLLIGVALLVLPGPGLLVIFLGVAVLASEFAWAASILHHSKKTGEQVIQKVKRTNKNSTPDVEETDTNVDSTERPSYE